MPFTKEEPEAIRLADEEIEQNFVFEQVDIEVDRWLDELALTDLTDNKQIHTKRQRRAYREANKDKLAEYMRAYREGKRRREKAIVLQIAKTA